ncbi:MAG: flagellar basal body P-ring formation chaperone FlgA [Verrucomicrobia bacterium]|nr:flagellar basal body P-ring formation protein FlgA [Verrucomicrobiota bacterium]MDA0723175.1 flagellar basal body P-ring formation chaperone FlgA [Verrucomicrobiota bacterium]MDA1047619.1 flagellar basal body P-ring formation chaperone FlgA [Verrucomicrobiota bacterium]
MRLVSILFASFSLSALLQADVTRLLPPLDLGALQPVRTAVTRSGFISSGPSIPSSYTASISKVKGSVILDAELLEKKIASVLSHRYQASGHVLARLSREWKPLNVPVDWEFKLQQSIPDELSANAFMRFSISSDGLKLGEWGYPVKCSQMVDVAVAKVPLNRGSRITPDLLSSSAIDALGAGANCILSDARLNGYQVTTSLKPGTVLKWSHLSKVTLVRKGQVVNVFASGKGIFVEMKGQAMEDGVEGSFVRIRNISSNREFQAKVLNENSVKVYF